MIDRQQIPRTPGVLYALLAVGVVALALAGYVGFRLYPRLGLPAVEGAALLVLAVAAGTAAFFSPCSFPLLATILSREVGAPELPRRQRTLAALRFALALSLGATAFLLLAGLVVGLGGSALVRTVTFGSPTARAIRIVVGLFLIVMGLVQIGVLRTPWFHTVEQLGRPLQRQQAELRRDRPDLGYALFGFGYVFAGFG